MIDTFEKLELNNNFAGDFDIQAGLAYDVSGLGVFVDPNDFVNGRVGYEGKPGMLSIFDKKDKVVCRMLQAEELCRRVVQNKGRTTYTDAFLSDNETR